jgi:hypothetical protein
LLFYYSFFGYYGILKYFIEKRTRLFIGLLLKIPIFLAALILNYFIAFTFIPVNAGELFSFPILLVVATPVFIAYDYLYTLFISFYENRVRKFIGRK